MALGIGANSAIFSILNALLFKSLPVAAPNQLFLLREQSRAIVPQRFSYPMFLRFRDSGSGAEGIAAMSHVPRAQTSIEAGAQPEMAPVQLVSGEFFSVLGLSPVLGRLLTPSDNQSIGGHPVAVIADGYLAARLCGILRRNRTNHPRERFPIHHGWRGAADFRGVWLELPTDIWIPLMMQASVHYAQNFSDHQDADPEKPWIPQEFIEWLDVMVRVDAASAPAIQNRLNGTFVHSMETLAGTMDADTRRYFLERNLTFEPFAHGLSNARQRFASPLAVIMAMVALVLLIACANTANLLLARAEGRRREIAVRLSIGASRSRLIQQLLTESFLLVAVAAGLGLLLARWASEQLIRMAFGVAAGSRTPFAPSLDGHVLLFTTGVTVATGLLFGLAPAFRATNLELGAAMKAASRNTPGRFDFVERSTWFPLKWLSHWWWCSARRCSPAVFAI